MVFFFFKQLPTPFLSYDASSRRVEIKVEMGISHMNCKAQNHAGICEVKTSFYINVQRENFLTCSAEMVPLPHHTKELAPYTSRILVSVYMQYDINSNYTDSACGSCVRLRLN